MSVLTVVLVEVFIDSIAFVESFPPPVIDEKRNLILSAYLLHLFQCLLISDIPTSGSWIVIDVRDTEFHEFLTYLFAIRTVFSLVEFQHAGFEFAEEMEVSIALRRTIPTSGLAVYRSDADREATGRP